MNFYNPYFSSMPYSYTPSLASRGLFSKLAGGGIKWGNILNYAQRTMSLINQGIPLIKQASPIVKNAKTMFRVMNEFKKIDSPNSIEKNNYSSNTKNNNHYMNRNVSNNMNLSKSDNSDNGAPVFFI
ncbi:MAG TPA: hypothetical protein GX747_04035 [Tenericutes bacterium]|nr:hypothetical protein [Mycoplasmatota bacterium]